MEGRGGRTGSNQIRHFTEQYGKESLQSWLRPGQTWFADSDKVNTQMRPERIPSESPFKIKFKKKKKSKNVSIHRTTM